MKLLIHYGAEKPFILIGSKKTIIPNRIRSNNVLELIEACLFRENKALDEIGEIEVYPGPGRFTSVRVAVSIANILAKTLNVPVRYYQGKVASQIIPEYGQPVSISKHLPTNR